MKAKIIRQKVAFKATPHEVYELLMDSKKHSMLSGGVAKVSRKAGGTFSVYDGYATGKNIELVDDKKIVQTWHASDWEDGYVSKVSFTLAGGKSGCILTFVHEGVPVDQYADIKKGWEDFYWKPMKEMLARSK